MCSFAPVLLFRAVSPILQRLVVVPHCFETRNSIVCPTSSSLARPSRFCCTTGFRSIFRLIPVFVHEYFYIILHIHIVHRFIWLTVSPCATAITIECVGRRCCQWCDRYSESWKCGFSTALRGTDALKSIFYHCSGWRARQKKCVFQRGERTVVESNRCRSA